MKWFCNHKWIILSDTTTISKFEHAMGIIKDSGAQGIVVPHQMSSAERVNIQIVSCLDCGKLKRYLTTI